MLPTLDARDNGCVMGLYLQPAPLRDNLSPLQTVTLHWRCGIDWRTFLTTLQSSPRSVNRYLKGPGPHVHNKPLFKSPLGPAELRATPLEGKYKTIPQVHLNHRAMRNRLLSGSSAVSYGAWTRGDAANYDYWAEIVGDPRWSYAGMLFYFRRSEHHHDPTAEPVTIAQWRQRCISRERGAHASKIMTLYGIPIIHGKFVYEWSLHA